MAIFPLNQRVLSGITMVCLLVMFTGVFQACKAPRHSMYFMSIPRDTAIQTLVDSSKLAAIKAGDMLDIEVSSLNRELDEKFNAAEPESVAGSAGPKGFVVAPDGQLELHYIGKMQAEGLTTRALAKNIQDALKPYLKEPIVQVQYLNHRITVMGEVTSPKVIDMHNRSLTILDALAMAGEIKLNGDKQKVMLLRDSNSVRQVRHLNLEKHDVISSPYFILKPNDIVYVMPRTDKYADIDQKRNTQMTIALISSTVSLLILVLSLFNNN